MRDSLLYLLIVLVASTISCDSTKKLSAQSSLNSDYIIQGSFKLIEEDRLGNIYTVNQRNEIKKYDSDHQLLFQFSTNKLGDIYSLDVSNPQKLLVYFGDFQNIMFLDNTLSEIKRLDLQDLGLWNIQAVGLSADNFIWMYNPINFNMVKINENGEELLQSNELFSGQITNTSDTEIIANLDNVILKDGKKMILFDNYGSLQRELLIQSEKLQLIKNLLVYSLGKQLKQESLDIISINNMDILYEHDFEIIDFAINKENKLLILDKYGVKLTYVQ